MGANTWLMGAKISAKTNLLVGMHILSVISQFFDTV